MLLRSGPLVVVFLLSVLFEACGGGPSTQNTATVSQPAQSPAREARPPGGIGYTGPLPPLPVPQFAPARPDAVVRAVYEFAARHPEVLRYVPCFCGCERNGHQDNEDCFVSGREPDGKPRWDLHGMG